ncbi:MAG: riboflavin biosynthesis protein RibF [Prevotella sp.]|jgi:riboflavin kinase/FMN adenylyltransferase|nr:riboflavin biosynthesis protein RibF [Prevotella sp.]
MLVFDSNRIIEHQPFVATVGFFDGVHTGHRYLAEQVKAEAAKRGLPSAVVTFPVHPRIVLNKTYQPALLCGYDEKIARLGNLGVDYCIVQDFTPAISQLTAKKFMQDILKNQINVDTLIVGYDHRFGYNREEGFADYVEHGREIGLNVLQAEEMSLSEHVSSSRIRRLLGTGNVVKAAQLLGYNYTISGKIVEGFHVGRTIGFPTANIKIWEDFKVVPAFGVYAVQVRIGDETYGGMLYIGKRPTLQNNDDISLEVNIFGFDGDLYDHSLTVEFIEFVRPDKKFPDLDALKDQITKDKEEVQELLGRNI